MNIIAIIDNKIGVGGGFDQALSAIIQMKRLAKDRFNFSVFTTDDSNMLFLNKLGVESKKVNISIIDKLLTRLSQSILWYDIQKYIKIIGPLERKLINNGCDLVYFVTPSNLPSALQKLNYIFTLWDLCHRENPEFPEVRNFNSFSIREKNYLSNLSRAFLIITESEKLIHLAAHYYGIDKSRFLAMPLSATPFIDKIHSDNKQKILKKYNLQKNYFYYPAQFWAHKNHIRILQALIILRDNYNLTPNIVFSGRDYGNLNYINNFIKNNGLLQQVKILGFVPSGDIRGLYENAFAVIMPTYFGPTNLPPLESWYLSTPLIYSLHLSEQVGKAALLVNPDNVNDLVKAMILIKNTIVRKKLISAGHKRFIEVAAQRKLAEKKLSLILNKFSLRLECG